MRSREARRHGDLETRRPGDKETGGQEARSKKQEVCIWIYGLCKYV